MEDVPPFDLYLHRKPRKIIERRFLPEINEEDISKVVRCESGWIDLSLEFTAAAKLLSVIIEAGGSGEVASIKYRTPLIKEIQARESAVTEIEKRCAELSNREGKKIRCGEVVQEPAETSSIRVYTFSALSSELQEMGKIPGRICVHVDKLSGKIVPPKEIFEYQEAVEEAQGVIFNDKKLRIRNKQGFLQRLKFWTNL